MKEPLTRPPPVCTGRYRPPSGTLSPGRGQSFLDGVEIMKIALSPLGLSMSHIFC